MTHSVRDTSSGRDPSLCGESLSEPSFMSNQAELLAIVQHELEDIEVDENDRCKWTDIANAQTHIMAQIRRLAASAPAGDAVAWRCRDKIFNSWEICDSAELVAARRKYPDQWEIVPLYARPQAVEVRDIAGGLTDEK